MTFNLPKSLLKPKYLALAIFAFFALILGIVLAFSNSEPNSFKAEAVIPNEPTCNNSTLTNSSVVNTFNPYKIGLNRQSADFSSCTDMPLLSHVDIQAGNPRDKGKTNAGQRIKFQMYYNWGVSGSTRVRNPVAKVQFVKVDSPIATEDRYEIRGTYTGTYGSNNTPVTVNSAERGGNLIVRVDKNSTFRLIPNSTEHSPDAMERTYVLDASNKVSPWNNSEWNKVTSRVDTIPDTTSNNLTMNPLYTAFPGTEFASLVGSSGFTIKSSVDPDYCTTNSAGEIASCNYSQTPFLKGGFMDQGFISSQIQVVAPQAQTPSYELTKICVLPGTSTRCNSGNRRTGQAVEYQITVRNTGTVAISNVVLTDEYNTDNDGRNELTNINTISDGGVNNSQTQKITWSSIASLAAGASKRVTFRAVVSDQIVNGEEILNTAKVTATGLNQLTATAVFNVIKPEIEAIKKCFVKDTTTPCESATLKSGDDITYKIEVTNNSGTTVFNPKVVDTYESDKIENIRNGQPAPVNIASNPLVWDNLPDLADGGSLTVSFDATIKAGLASGTEIKNLAVVSADDVTDKNLEHIFDIVVTDINAVKECKVKATSRDCGTASPRITIGDLVIYSITVENEGSTDLEEVQVVDTYDHVKLTNISAISDSGVKSGNNVITWNIGTLTPGQKKTVTFEATISDQIMNGDKIVNLAVVKAKDKTDINLRNEFPVVLDEPLLIESVKTCKKLGTNIPCENASMRPGQSVEYTIIVRNTGGATAEDVVLVDDYPQNLLTSIRSIDPIGTDNGDKITWPAVDIIAGGFKTYKFTATIKTDLVSGTQVVNLGVITAKNHPQINLRHVFRIVTVVMPGGPTTIPTGGLETFGIVLFIGGIAYLIYYTKKHPKWTSRFIPKRSTEINSKEK
jgi:uncharacterized repeat protein (TIGR01451 family)